MTIREYLEASSLPPRVYHKDCQVIEVTPISPRYALIALRIPLPIGGDHQEIVALDEKLEIVESR